jgi:hypothetical protein
MVRTVPAVAIVKDLVPSGFPLELHHENRLHVRPLTGSRPRINGFDGDALLKQVELLQFAAWSSWLAFKVMIRRASFFHPTAALLQ